MINDEQLELDEVAGDFCDWFSERLYMIQVRHVDKHRRYIRQHDATMQVHYEKDVARYFGHDLSFYTRKTK